MRKILPNCMKFILIYISFIAFQTNSDAQFVRKWVVNQEYTNDYDDTRDTYHPVDMAVTSDGYTYVVGTRHSNPFLIGMERYVFIIKYSPGGSKIWEGHYGYFI